MLGDQSVAPVPRVQTGTLKRDIVNRMMRLLRRRERDQNPSLACGTSRELFTALREYLDLAPSPLFRRPIAAMPDPDRTERGRQQIVATYRRISPMESQSPTAIPFGAGKNAVN